ncbi:hypothetical protein RUM43_000546 [Polyplax serrata]|uniref:Uncharacterized protein n=1 Tax=Polyplax serrata TaxID=468196 RepID=A0AAN8SDH6_POLSC
MSLVPGLLALENPSSSPCEISIGKLCIKEREKKKGSNTRSFAVQGSGTSRDQEKSANFDWKSDYGSLQLQMDGRRKSDLHPPPPLPSPSPFTLLRMSMCTHKYVFIKRGEMEVYEFMDFWILFTLFSFSLKLPPTALSFVRILALFIWGSFNRFDSARPDSASWSISSYRLSSQHPPI